MPFTYEDLLEIPEDIRCEILEGELIVNAPRTLRHQRVLMALATLISKHLNQSHAGILIVGPVDVVLTPHWVLTPDILYVRKERKSIITKTNISGAPDLTVEVLDDSTRERDEITKRQVYEGVGVAEYWIVDPVLESIKIYRRTDTGRYDRVVEMSTETPDATITSPLFPDLEISLAEVFAE
jgi:Uma2 family endonuclease